MADDIFLNYYGHPLLPTGYNSWENDGDEVNGPGVNEPIWPMLFDTFMPLKVMFITDEMMDIFETGCPDYIAPCVPNTIVFPTEIRTQIMRRTA